MPMLSITLLFPWEKRFTIISKQALCAAVSQRHIAYRKKLKNSNKTSGHGTAGVFNSKSEQQLPYT